ncbi:MAG: tetratricopeptide repeat protein [Nitrospirae bacterium]|nr:tetratricopeptide repeat protein [Nitrospirota bacterium]
MTLYLLKDSELMNKDSLIHLYDPLKTRNLDISEEHLDAIHEIIIKRSGLQFSKKKGYDLKEAVSTAFLTSACERIEDYVHLLSTLTYNSRIELEKLASLLTIKETYFFRDTHQFETLRDYILPEIINKKKTGDKKIRIWSAGCATGEEAYSIAIILSELIPEINSWDILLLATDIDTEALSKAQKGEFRKWSFRGVPEKIIENYFINENGIFRIDERFKKNITFSTLNLKEDEYPSILNNTNNIDLIICRNVTIYFDKDTTREVIDKFYNSINEGGYLLVGHSEHFSEYYKKFIVRPFPHTICYQKLEAAKPRQLEDFSLYLKGIKFRDEKPFKSAAEKIPLKETVSPQRIRQNECSEETKIFQEAIQLFKENNYDTAAERLIEILELNPKNMRACVLLAQISANRGDIIAAIKWCDESLEIDNLNLEAYYLLSLIYEGNGDLDKAVSLLRKVVYIDPHFAIGHFNLGRAYKKQGKIEKSQKSFENAKLLLKKEPKKLAGSLSEGEIAELIEVINKELAVLESSKAQYVAPIQ